MTKNEQKILTALKRHEQLSVREIEAITGIKYSTAKDILSQLRHAGIAHVSGSGRMAGGHGGFNYWSLGVAPAKPKKFYQKDDAPIIKRRRGSWHEIPLASNWLEMCHPYRAAA